MAEVFTVKQGGKPVPTRSDIRCTAENQRNVEHQRTSELIARHFPKTNTEAEPAQMERSPQAQSEVPDQRIASMARDIGDMRAAFELTVEQNERLFAQNERIIELNRSIVDTSKRQNEQIAQAIQAIARLAENISRQNQGVVDSFSGATMALKDLTVKSWAAPAPLSAAPEPEPEPTPEPPIAVEAAPEPATPAEAPKAPRKRRCRLTEAKTAAPKPEPLPMKPLPRVKRPSRLFAPLDREGARPYVKRSAGQVQQELNRRRRADKARERGATAQA